MKIRRFVAKDMRTALIQIKAELGADAVIMSNKKIPEGVELMAAVDYSQTVPEAKAPNTAGINQTITDETELSKDVVSLRHSQEHNHIDKKEPSLGAMHEEVAQPVDSLSALLNRKIQAQSNNNESNGATTDSVDNITEQLKSFTNRLQHQNTRVEPSYHAEQDNAIEPDTSPSHNQQQSALPNVDSQQAFDQLKNEMLSIRQLLEHQVSGLMWQDMAQKDPMRAMLVDRLSSMGFTEQIADQLASYVPENYHQADAWQLVLELVAEQIRTTNNDIIQRGGVVALVGPTGVGKTTTIAKLAARFAQIHGADQIALISTDTFRIAGFEQLATYGKIIGCQVQLAKDTESLAQLLLQFKMKKLVLIDTAGMGQRDLRLVEHLATLIANSRVRIRNYLVLAANTQQRVMQENVERFKKIPLAGCIYTKLDESVSVGEIISTSIQNGLPIGYLTDGQRVPEDIKVANAKKLVMLANKMSSTATQQLTKNWRTNNTTPLTSAV